MLCLKGIRKTYRNSNVETNALNGIDLTIERGEFAAIMGRSGCGKSTLLNIIGLMDNYDKGIYKFNEIDISTLSFNDKASFRNKTIGFVFQSFNLINEMTVLENVEVPMGYAGVGTKMRKKRAMEMLEQVDMADKANNFPNQLSGGQQQRVAIARALANKPEIILADEPTGNLDSKNADDIMEVFKELHKLGNTILLVTHDDNVGQGTERIIRMEDGLIVNEVRV